MSSIKRFRIIKWKKDHPVLSAKSISKSYGRKMVLRKIDLELQRGEMLGFLGSNGAGKSTFMSIVLGLQKSDYGDVFLGSKKITSLPIHIIFLYISVKLPAIVISSTGYAISPFSIQKPEAPLE